MGWSIAFLRYPLLPFSEFYQLYICCVNWPANMFCDFWVWINESDRVQTLTIIHPEQLLVLSILIWTLQRKSPEKKENNEVALIKHSDNHFQVHSSKKIINPLIAPKILVIKYHRKLWISTSEDISNMEIMKMPQEIGRILFVIATMTLILPTRVHALVSS